MALEVGISPQLLLHLQSFEVDTGTVADVFFEGGRLSYPERRRMEYELGFSEPYLLDHEARVIKGMDLAWNSAVRFLSRIATRRAANDPTLELLWGSHDTFAHLSQQAGDPALDRLIASLVVVQEAMMLPPSAGLKALLDASVLVIRGLHSVGFPPTALSLEEICDGAMPACVGLNLVDVDWR